MTEEVPAAPAMPACNGSAPPEDGPLQGVGVTDETPKSAGMVPCANVETSPDAPPAKEALEENRNSLAEDIAPGDPAGEKLCQEKREEKDGMLQQGPADIQDTGTDGQGSGEGPGGTEGLQVSSGESPVPGASPSEEAEQSLAAGAEPRGNEAEEEEEAAEEEEDTEEDEVQVIEIKKEDSQGSHLRQQGSCKEPPALASPGCNSPLEKAGEQSSLGKRNDISRHSYSRYNTISYRRIRKGNTKQRIDEFESMMHL